MNPYSPPTANVDLPASHFVGNNSGGGSQIEVPAGVKGWSWGAFFFNWIWSIFNRTWIGLLCFVPYVGVFMSFYLGFKGREMAWKNKRWDSFEHFERVQKRWSFWAVLIFVGVFGIGILAAVAIPAYQGYVHRLRG